MTIDEARTFVTYVKEYNLRPYIMNMFDARGELEKLTSCPMYRLEPTIQIAVSSAFETAARYVMNSVNQYPHPVVVPAQPALHEKCTSYCAPCYGRRSLEGQIRDSDLGLDL